MEIVTNIKRIGILSIIVSYLSALLTWKGIVDLAPTISWIAAFLIIVIGTLAGTTGLPYEIWSDLTGGRSEAEEQVIKPAVIFIIWLFFTICLSWYIGIFSAAIGGVLVILYFSLAIGGNGFINTDSIWIILVGGIVHLVSLLGAIVLILHCIKA